MPPWNKWPICFSPAMSLLSNNILCRFIRPKDWSTKFKRPTPQAFKQMALSVWHKGWLDQQLVSLDELRIGSLEGAGQAHHTVQDYHRFADEASLSIEIRPSPDNVEAPWQQWRDAHCEVNVTASPTQCLQSFRNLLVAQSRVLVPPDMYNDV